MWMSRYIQSQFNAIDKSQNKGRPVEDKKADFVIGMVILNTQLPLGEEEIGSWEAEGAGWLVQSGYQTAKSPCW